MKKIQRHLGLPPGTRAGPEEGAFLVLAVIFLTFVLTLVVSTLSLVTTRVQDVRTSRNHIVARNAAESGLHQGIANVKLARDLASMGSPFGGIDAMDPKLAAGPGGYTQGYKGQPLRDTAGNRIAQFDVFYDVLRDSAIQRTVNVSSYAYVPSKADYAAQVPDASRGEFHVSIIVKVEQAGVFDYSYFINHWGWFFGNNIVANGSVRSNGQFDFGGYASTINGSPRYTGSSGYQLTGYQDDNEDGVTDGTDGGAYSGMAIVNAGNIRGMAALPQNQHSFTGMVPMPNIQDLSYYEAKAIAAGSSIKIGGTTHVNGVLGDGLLEHQHLYLVGTLANPIVINGPVVVRGDVVIQGYVTGQGSIYAGRNVYIAKDVLYKNGPTTPRPADNSQAATEAWRQASLGKDSLGLMAKEHIVVGNYTSSGWQNNVSGWVNHPLNKSDEDAGSDQIHNTKAGMDGVLGTADDDFLEGDGVWTVSKYTAADLAAGRIPAGKSVGDVIPGTGEDADGDGVRDYTTSMSEFNLQSLLISTLTYAGNAPLAEVTYGSISSNNLKRIDGVLYTNHTLAAYMIPGSSYDIQLNGAIVSKNEAIIYSARNMIMNHDERITGDGGSVFGFSIPDTWKPLELTNWETEKELPAATLGNPTYIAAYFKG
ncbi:MAG TPA: hypothetical protein VMT52_17875 [Planctomycetota bacterium]|nr:hypothetical protein [Planctomycetota bacterium]